MLAVSRAAAGAGLVAQLAVHWLSQGNGSTYAGARLASNLLHTDRLAGGLRVAGVAMFAVAFLGCSVVATATVESRVLDVSRLVVGATIVGTLAGLAVRGTPPLERWGPGFALTALSALALAATAVKPMHDRWARARRPDWRTA